MTAIHHIAWTLNEGTITGAVTCIGDDDERCRLDCPVSHDDSCSCDLDDLVPYGKCMFVEWLEIEPPQEFYRGDPTPPRDGPIDAEWDPLGQHWIWRYADVEDNQQGGCSNPCGKSDCTDHSCQEIAS